MHVPKAIISAALRSFARIQRLLTTWYNYLSRDRHQGFPKSASISTSLESVLLDDFCENFVAQLEPANLKELSNGLKSQFELALLSNPGCMLPSYNHLLPSGKEEGTFLALDVGGSTFRVAVIELLGDGNERIRVLSIKAFKINNAIKQLRGLDFFDWMALRIEETLAGRNHVQDGEKEQVLSMGLAWSFPIDQTSMRSGLLLGMGKGFRSAEGLLGQDLGDILQQACTRRNLKVCLQAIVNDSAATLLSTAFTHPSTRFGLVLGTGVNIAAYLPVNLIGMPKFGTRPRTWHDQASHVIVNTEISMFGQSVLPYTCWDEQLNRDHILPNFQPLEHFVGGRYLGEISRLIFLEGIKTVRLCGGVVPESLEQSYTLETELLARIQYSKSPNEARHLFKEHHPSACAPSDTDMAILRLIAMNVSRRASAILAAAIHALWHVQREAEAKLEASRVANRDGDIAKKGASVSVTEQLVLDPNECTISPLDAKMAYNGSVIESYPEFRQNCQSFLDLLFTDSVNLQPSKCSPSITPPLELVGAKESSLLGAAVAVAVAVSQ